jgi:hypothetical protein
MQEGFDNSRKHDGREKLHCFYQPNHVIGMIFVLVPCDWLA